MEIFREFSFDAAHFLPYVPADHKCGRIHGHTYKVIIYVTAEINLNAGWVMDFADIKTAFQPLLEILDHRFLNSIEGLENPTSENIARWIWQKLKPNLPQLSKVVVLETCNSGAVFTGDEL